MAEILETQEQFPVKAGVQELESMVSLISWIPACAGMMKADVSVSFIF
jgi:hypothetical protein